MKRHASNDERDALARISEILSRSSPKDQTGDQTEFARVWIKEGFDDEEDVEDWLRAKVFDPASARRLEDAGVTPEQAATLTRAGRDDREETLGLKFSRGDLSLEEVRRIAVSEFWND